MHYAILGFLRLLLNNKTKTVAELDETLMESFDKICVEADLLNKKHEALQQKVANAISLAEDMDDNPIDPIWDNKDFVRHVNAIKKALS